MTRPTLRVRRALILAVGATLVLPVPAMAHPFIQGGEAPVDSLASLTLELGHGCSDDGDDHGGDDEPSSEEPTTEVALEVPEQMRIVDVPDVEGFEVELEAADDGRVEVVTWAATTSTAPAPELPFDVVLSGEPGDELFLRVFQACDDLSYRWAGTPDEPADDPAVQLTLTEPDPDNPAPDPAEDTPAESAADPTSSEDPTDEEDPTEGEDPPVEDEAATAEAAEEEPPDADTEEAASSEEMTVATPGEPEDSPLLWGVVILVGSLLLIALILALRPRPAAAPAPDAGDDDPGTGADETEIR